MKKFFVLFLVLFFTVPVIAMAQEYKIKNFDAEYWVNDNGSLKVRETIVANFLVKKRGIYRVIPERYKVDENIDLKTYVIFGDITDGEGNRLITDVSRSYDDVTLRIGEVDKFFTGEKKYVINYTVSSPFLYFDDHDELYWNVTGDRWDTVIERSSAIFYLPSGARMTGASCYTGVSGSTATDCSIVENEGVVRVTGKGFLTLAVGFTPDVITEVAGRVVDTKAIRDAREKEQMQWIEKKQKRREQGYYLTALLLFVLPAFAFLFSYVLGRDEKYGKKTVIARFEAPDDLRPTELAVILDGKLNKRDFSAAIIDLAVRGYISISEKDKSYTLERKKTNKGLREWEIDLMNAIFGSELVSSSIKMRARVPAYVHSIKRKIFQELISRGYLQKEPERVRNQYVMFLFLFELIVFFIVGYYSIMYFDSLVPIVGVIVIFAPLSRVKRFIRLRTKEGMRIVNEVYGLKLFIKTAERYRVKWQEQEGIFEKYLPYAMVFRMVKKWTKKFNKISIEYNISQKNPTWYTGDIGKTFDVIALTGVVNSFSKSVSAGFSTRNAYNGSNSRYRAPRSGGSSGGFSSGISSGGGGSSGSSGGGFGGGGGGSW